MLKIAFITYADPGVTFQDMPRGTFAYMRYLEQFGHTIAFFDKSHCHRIVGLIRAVRLFKPDVIVGQHVGAFLAVLFRHLRLVRCPVVHAWDDYYDEQSRLPLWLARPFEKISVIGADQITSVSRYNIHRAEMWGTPAAFIPHGVEPNQRAGKLVLDSSRFKIVYLGDQGLYKGTRRLMEAMEGVEADLFMVGTVNPDLVKIAPSNVRFVGRIPPQEVQSALRQADLLVNPSDQDSNFKLQEYIRAAKPILGVSGRMGWAFKHGQDVWLTDDLRKGIVCLLGDPGLRARLVEGMKAHPVLDWEHVAREMEAVLIKVHEMKSP